MDWDGVIEKNREALKRVLAALAAMAGLDCGNYGGQFTFFPQKGARLQDAALAEKSKLSLALTLPRHLHRAVLRILRPAEAAVRRLVIIAARDLVVPPLRPRKPRPDPKAGHAVLRSLGIAVVVSPADLARAAAEKRAAEKRAAARAIRQPVLPLFDPLRIPRPGRPRYVPAHAAPRILSFDGARPHRLPPPPSPGDPIDATRLALRLQALGRALDDLPGHARRFARWKMRRDRSLGSGRFHRIAPLRAGRPPGARSARNRRPAHEVHEVLSDLQYFARKALERPDTS